MGEYFVLLCWCASVAPVGKAVGIVAPRKGVNMQQKMINRLLSLPMDERQNLARHTGMGHASPLTTITGSRLVGAVEDPKASRVAQKQKASTK